MCGRYMMTSPVAAIRHTFRIASMLNLGPRYNIAPMQPVPIIRLAGDGEWAEKEDDNRRGLTLAQWGLVPSWMKELPASNPMINARAETVLEKPSFRGAMRHHRCLIPANGFYEWQKQDQGQESGPKQPWLIHLTETRDDGLPLFAFAGLSEMWTGPDGGSALETAAILTTAANEKIAPVHHRMPVILRPRDYALWLGEEAAAPKDVLAGLTPFDASDFELRAISTRVNRVANDDAEIVAPLGKDEGGRDEDRVGDGAEGEKTVDATAKDKDPQGELF